MEAHADFSNRCIPEEAGPTQQREMKRAFYAGATSAMAILRGAVRENLSVEGGTKRLRDLDLELLKFALLVGAGLE
jgi:hypothetical protein